MILIEINIHLEHMNSSVSNIVYNLRLTEESMIYLLYGINYHNDPFIECTE